MFHLNVFYTMIDMRTIVSIVPTFFPPVAAVAVTIYLEMFESLLLKSKN